MKNSLLFILLNLTIISVFAQVPNAFKYQAVIRDDKGSVKADSEVGIMIKILEKSSDGDVIYEETHTVITNAFGLVNLEIGAQDPAYFAAINWSEGPFFIEVFVDINGGTNYHVLGASQLMSVPFALYALHAKTAEHSIDTLYVIDTTTPPTFTGSFIANVVDDYGAVGDGSTSNTLAFSDALEENNDIFIPASDSSYVLSSLTIPENKRLWFERGAQLEITGTLTGSNTEIVAGNYQIFTSNSSIAGTWKGGIAYDEWLDSEEQIEGMQAMVTTADTTRWGDHIVVSDSIYGQSWDGNMEVATKNTIYDKIETIQIDGGSFPSSFIANVVDDYGAIGDGTTDNEEAFTAALSENNDVFIPNASSNYNISSLTVQKGKRLWFEGGSVLDINNELILKGEIVAGMQQIFTKESAGKINADSAVIEKAYVEWFGAKGDSLTESASAIEKTLQVFTPNKVIANGPVYLLEETIDFPRNGNLEAGQNTRFHNTPDMTDPFLKVTKAPFYLLGGTWQPLHYSDMSGGDQSDAYKNWLWDFLLEWVPGGEQSQDFRRNSYIRDVRLVSPIVGETNRQMLVPNGLRVRAAAPYGKDYFTEVNNLYIGCLDSALYVQGSADESTGGMLNSWTWNGYKPDNNITAIILGNRAAGHVFTGLQLQPRNAGQPLTGKYPSIDISSCYNVIHGMAWDLWCDSTIVLRSTAAYNEINSLGWDGILRYVKYEGNIHSNEIGSSPIWYKSRPYYGDVMFRGRKMGLYSLYSSCTWGCKDDEPRGLLDIVNSNDNGYIPAIFESYTSANGNGSLDNFNEVQTNLILRSQSSNDDTGLTKGFGGFIRWEAAKDADGHAIMEKRLGLIGFRMDGSNNDTESGAFQVWNGNNSLPSLTIRNNRRVGIGTSNPVSKLEIVGTTTISDVLKIKPRSSAPLSPTKGMIYVSSTNNHIYYYNGSVWRQLD